MGSEARMCPVFHPTAEEFGRPFIEYVRGVFKTDPDLPMFKVVPPAGWRPRRTKIPNLQDVTINTPIRQNAVGTKGAYRCIFVEAPRMTAAEFKVLAEEEGAMQQELSKRQEERLKGTGSEDARQERTFWSSMTMSPPLYGADTPMSFFDAHLSTGWNLRDLGDLLKVHHVPDIAGVTSPMMYFGMWRSFFGWHLEDADLYSTNFLHFGAPKMWYAVSPKDRKRFDNMAQSLFPQLHRICHGFVRHKDIMLSPAVLRTYHIPFMQAKQEAGQYVVLNAAAYHSGFNMGFNCAEAVNFGLEEWIPLGRAAGTCTCDAMRDCVRIDMNIFDTRWQASSDSDDDQVEILHHHHGHHHGNHETHAGVSPNPGQTTGSGSLPPCEVACHTRGALARSTPAAAAAVGTAPRGQTAPPPGRAGSSGLAGPAHHSGAVADIGGTERARAALGAAGAGAAYQALASSSARVSRALDGAADVAAMKGSGGAVVAAGGMGGTGVPPPPERGSNACSNNETIAGRLPKRVKLSAEGASAATPGGQQHKVSAVAGPLGQKLESRPAKEFAGPSTATLVGATSPKPAAAAAVALRSSACSSSGRSTDVIHALARGHFVTPIELVTSSYRRALLEGGPASATEPPAAIVCKTVKGVKFFQLVQLLQAAKRQTGPVLLQLLEASPLDGLYRAVQRFAEEPATSLVVVRSQWRPVGAGGAPGGWKLLTLPSRIIDETDLDCD